MRAPATLLLPRRRLIGRGLAVASGVTMALALRARGGIAAQEEPMTASGGGVNLKLMPDVEGDPRAPLRGAAADRLGAIRRRAHSGRGAYANR